MRIRWWIGRTIFAVTALLVVIELVVIHNLARINSEQYTRIQKISQPYQAQIASDSLQRLRREALSRAALYDELIKRDMLLDGMVIHRGVNGQAEGVCDSLLFSSLRFYALTKLGFNKSADDAWNGILGSRDGAQWRRHPKCAKSLSRDMIMGVLVALSANPEGGDTVFRSMLAEIDRNGGFVGDGPFYVSWLSPGVAGLLRMEAERRGVPFTEWPWILKQSFSSIEYDAMFIGEGYVSHLAALGLWLEMSHAKSGALMNPRSLLGRIERVVSGGSDLDTALDKQRREWITGRLRSLSGSNIFFEWLDEDASGSMNPEAEARLLSDLLSMPQFPKNRLPRDCDRDADYLWQRRDGESVPVVKRCGATWSGVDFLWMAAVLGASAANKEDDDENQRDYSNFHDVTSGSTPSFRIRAIASSHFPAPSRPFT